MTDKQFREQVRRMRAAQKEYFQYRLKSSLDYSRKLEREVDAELRKSEPALFPETEGINLEEAVAGTVHHVMNCHYIMTDQEALSARLRGFPEGTVVNIFICKAEED